MMCGRLAADQTENEELVTAYISEEIEYRDEVIPVQYVDDLSLLADMKYTDGTYACQDGRLYYRRYHEDSFEERRYGEFMTLFPIRKKKLSV